MKLSFLQKDACIAIGLMSGTSADGIDAARGGAAGLRH